MSLSVTKTNGVCSNGYLGSATVNPIYGTAPYTYSWSNGDTSKTVTGLEAGSYSVTVTDANGCTTSTTTAISVTKSSSDYSTINVFGVYRFFDIFASAYKGDRVLFF